MIYWPARKWKSPCFYVRNLVTTTLMPFACAEPIKHIKHVLSVLYGLVYGKKDESPRQYLYYFHINSSEVCGLPKNEEVKRIFSPNIVSYCQKKSSITHSVSRATIKRCFRSFLGQMLRVDRGQIKILIAIRLFSDCSSKSDGRGLKDDFLFSNTCSCGIKCFFV